MMGEPLSWRTRSKRVARGGVAASPGRKKRQLQKAEPSDSGPDSVEPEVRHCTRQAGCLTGPWARACPSADPLQGKEWSETRYAMERTVESSEGQRDSEAVSEERVVDTARSAGSSELERVIADALSRLRSEAREREGVGDSSSGDEAPSSSRSGINDHEVVVVESAERAQRGRRRVVAEGHDCTSSASPDAVDVVDVETAEQDDVMFVKETLNADVAGDVANIISESRQSEEATKRLLECPVCYRTYKADASADCGVTVGAPQDTDTYSDLYVTKCGHMFCGACISRAVAGRQKCPKCNQTITPKQFFRAYV